MERQEKTATPDKEGYTVETCMVGASAYDALSGRPGTSNRKRSATPSPQRGIPTE